MPTPKYETPLGSLASKLMSQYGPPIKEAVKKQGPMFAGSIAGAMSGAELGAMGGPIGVGLGGLIGAGIGAAGGEAARQMATGQQMTGPQVNSSMLNSFLGAAAPAFVNRQSGQAQMPSLMELMSGHPAAPYGPRINPLDEEPSQGIALMAPEALKIHRKAGVEEPLVRQRMKASERGKSTASSPSYLRPSDERLQEMVANAESLPFAKDWYVLKKKLIKAIARDPKFFLQAFGATSVQKSPKLNLRLAMQADELRYANPNVDFLNTDLAHFKAVKKSLNEISKGGKAKGPKVEPYVEALSGNKQAAVVDRWMLRIYGVNPNKFTQAERAWVEKQIRLDAQKFGYGDNIPAFQSLLWHAIKKEVSTLKGAEPPSYLIQQILDQRKSAIENANNEVMNRMRWR